MVRQAFPSCSFREFNPLFNRNRIALQGSGIFGENSTYGGEGLVSGIYNKLSFSGGYTHFETDGWRKNADIDDDIVNVFGQLKLTYKTSFQAEYRYRENKRGDTQLSFFEDDFSPDLRQEDKTKTARLGIRHAFSPGSTLIGNFSYQDTEIQYDDISDLGDNLSPFNLDISLDNDADAFGGELQNLFRSKYIQLVTGAGHFDIDSKVKIKITAEFPVDFVREATEDLDLHHTNVYLYSYIYFPMDVTLTIGASADFFESDVQPDQDEDQFNPKFGITWSPFLGTTLRGAAFRTLKRTLISDQTIEPTQVAGFNQFFDDFNATEAWRYGAAIDQIFSKNIYGGVEISKRDLEVPVVFAGDKIKKIDWEEYFGRAYLYWTPHEWLALRAEYQYEEFKRDEDFAFGAKNVETHYIPLGINFSHPSGLSASLTGTYIDQSGKFERQDNTGTFEDGEDNFWLFDAAINYRLPKRYGFLTVGVTNLFDEDFEYFDTDIKGSPEPDKPVFAMPRIQPDRSVFMKFTLAF